VLISTDAFAGNTSLMLAIILGLCVGKPSGIVLFSYLVVRSGIAEKSPEYNWRQMLGVGLLAGIGFTMSLFIAGQAFPDAGEFAAAKIAVFIASILAGAAGVALLWPRIRHDGDDGAAAANCSPI
jgi:NhaA family Na+:H+ antiporter